MTWRLVPPLPQGVVALAEGCVSMFVGTRSRDLRPVAVRAMGLRVWPGACDLTVYLPVSTSARAVEHLRDNGQIAVTFTFPSTLETMQVKGNATSVRLAPEEDRRFVEAYREKLCQALLPVGLPVHVTRRLICWPAMAVDVRVAELFVQTPGPGAGDRMAAS